MSASPEELIAINSLLIEREAELSRVHNVEQRINQWLGDDYPFDAPQVELPSRIKKKAGKAKKADARPKPFKARRLNEGESAYRLTWIDRGQSTEQNVIDVKHVHSLLNDTLPGMKLLKIETVDLGGGVVEALFEA